MMDEESVRLTVGLAICSQAGADRLDEAERLPWWMRNRSGSRLASQYARRLAQTASASSREFTKTRHLLPRVRSKM